MTDAEMYAKLDRYLTKAAGSAVIGMVTFLFLVTMGALLQWL